MRYRVLALSLVAVLAASGPADAWSLDVHRWLVERAIPLLPAELRPFFEKHRAFIVEHSIDPDLWRTAGFTEEPSRHFLDLDAYGPYPFAELPRDYDEAVKKFGRETVDRNGLVPWRTAQIQEWLVKAFRQSAEPNQPYSSNDIRFYSAVIAHYVGDAHVPFHAALNYDGQLTNQHGIHSRFEGELMQRYGNLVRVHPTPAPPVRDARGFIFDRLISGFALVEPILAADRKAVAGREEYDDAYFDQFFAATREILERRLSEAASGIAATIAGAWEAAGRPAVPLDAPRRNRKVRRPGPTATSNAGITGSTEASHMKRIPVIPVNPLFQDRSGPCEPPSRASR